MKNNQISLGGPHFNSFSVSFDWASEEQRCLKHRDKITRAIDFIVENRCNMTFSQSMKNGGKEENVIPQ